MALDSLLHFDRQFLINFLTCLEQTPSLLNSLVLFLFPAICCFLAGSQTSSSCACSSAVKECPGHFLQRRAAAILLAAWTPCQRHLRSVRQLGFALWASFMSDLATHPSCWGQFLTKIYLHLLVKVAFLFKKINLNYNIAIFNLIFKF
jgi:hypothetical protein